ncbi:MAG TPA: DUF4256 domain-containing protein [Chitinophagaceae bacterium]
MASKNKPGSTASAVLLKSLQHRFDNNPHRHKGIKWQDVLAKLEGNNKKLAVLAMMEASGGEPDIIGYDQKSGEYIFCDCSAETPKGRRSLCYDEEALASRKEHKPKSSAVEMAAEMGVELISEEAYLGLQQIEDFDLKTSSWLLTPPGIREKGGAIFGDKRFGRTFIYHNGAESYYAARGFRGILRV